MIAPPSDSPVADIAGLFALERTRLLQLLRRLDSDDWTRPTACPGWTVLGLACHLLGDDFGLLSRRRDGYMGTAPPDGLDEVGFVDWLDQLQVEWVDGARRISPRLAIELLEWSGPRLVETLRSEALSLRSASVSWAGPDTVPVWLDQLRELSEYWIHRQQLHDALAVPVDLDPALLHPVLLGLRWAFAHRLSHVDPPIEGTVQITIGEPIGERWFLATGVGGWSFSDVATDPPVATASFSADQAWRLLTNNLDPESSLDLAGDPRVVATISQTRAIIGRPKLPGKGTR